jgi:DNA-binding transcriptional ArsR family regulator
MGITKSNIFSEEINEIASMAKVLGHPARIAILRHLIELNICICGDLVEEIGLAQATISQHLKVLKEAGFIKGSISGTSMCYCIDSIKWQKMQDIFNKFFNQQADNCC